MGNKEVICRGSFVFRFFLPLILTVRRDFHPTALPNKYGELGEQDSDHVALS